MSNYGETAMEPPKNHQFLILHQNSTCFDKSVLLPFFWDKFLPVLDLGTKSGTYVTPLQLLNIGLEP